jgi:hypothetical protein
VVLLEGPEVALEGLVVLPAVVRPGQVVRPVLRLLVALEASLPAVRLLPEYLVGLLLRVVLLRLALPQVLARSELSGAGPSAWDLAR